MKTNPYRTSNSATAVGVLFLLADGTVQSCNVVAKSILGYSAEQSMGASFLEQPHPAIDRDSCSFSTKPHPVNISLKTGQPCSDVIMGFYKPNGDLI